MPSSPADGADVRTRIAGWLLDVAVLRTGPHAGGVAGWFDEAGVPFLYPEAAGYLLTMLADLARREPAEASRAAGAAEAVTGWLARQVQDGTLPPTRLQLRPHEGDWRCSATFSFDLAILARGLQDAAPLLAADTIAPVLARTLRALDHLVDRSGDLAAARRTAGPPELPACWSTSDGFHRLKTAAALTARRLPLTPRLAGACARLMSGWRELPAVDGELHPYLYGLEGAALLALGGGGPATHEALARAVERVLVLLAGPGAPPARVKGSERTDVLAQALRLAAAFARGPEHRWLADALAERLQARVDREGAVRFAPSGPGAQHRNVWAAAFAWQALSWHAQMASGRSLSSEDIGLLV